MDSATVTALWGDFPSWAMVLVTLIGVIAAIKAGKIAIKASNYAKSVVKIELARDARRDEIESRSQASSVSAWTEMLQEIAPNGRQVVSLIAVANNGSHLPIYDVTCTWSVKDINGDAYSNLANLDAGLIPPDSPYRWPLDNRKFLENIHPDAYQVLNVPNALDVIQRSRVAIIFTDAEHRQWIRGSDGRLLLVGMDSRNPN